MRRYMAKMTGLRREKRGRRRERGGEVGLIWVLGEQNWDSLGRTALGCFFFSSRRRHTILQGHWSSDVCSSDLSGAGFVRSRDEAPAQRNAGAAGEFPRYDRASEPDRGPGECRQPVEERRQGPHAHDAAAHGSGREKVRQPGKLTKQTQLHWQFQPAVAHRASSSPRSFLRYRVTGEEESPRGFQCAPTRLKFPAPRPINITAP